MPIKKRGGSWQADIRVKGIRHRKAFESYDEAEKWLEATKYQLKHDIPMPQETWNLKKASEQCMKIEWEGKRSENTNRINIRKISEFFGIYDENIDEFKVDHIDLDAITTEVVDDFFIWCRDVKKNKKSTINRKLACLSKIMKFAYERGRLRKMPKFPRQKEPQGRVRFLTEKEEKKILSYFNGYLLDGKGFSSDLYDFTIVGLDTGFRRGELLNLETRDVVDGKLIVWENKTDVSRSVDMTPRVEEVIKRRKSFSDPFAKIFPFTKYVVRTGFENMSKDLGFTDVTPHILRHTFGTRLAKLRVPLKNIKTLMGHKVTSTTEKYMHLTDSDSTLDMNLLAEKYGSCAQTVSKMTVLQPQEQYIQI